MVLCSDVLYGHLETTAIALAETAHALCEPRAGAVFLSYFPREKLEADTPFFGGATLCFATRFLETSAGARETTSTCGSSSTTHLFNSPVA